MMSNRLDDSASQTYADAVWLQGAMVTAVLYGVVTVLSVTCWRALWPHIQPGSTGHRKTLFFFFYVTFLFLIGTVYVVCNSQVTQSGFINNRFYPGGPSAHEESTASLPLNFAFVFSSWCADLVMIWRCIVVYRNTKVYPVIVGFGIILFLAAVITGIFWLVIVSNPSPPSDSSGWVSFMFLCPFLSVDLIINIFISLLTVTRLLYSRHRISKVLGPGHGAIYASFAAILVESASVYSICSLLYLIPYAFKSPVSYAFMQMLGEAQIIAPLLIIYRIAEGKDRTDRSTPTPSATNDAIRMRRMTYPNASLAATVAAPTPLNVEVTFHTETIRDDGSIKLPRAHKYIEDMADTHAPVASAV